MKKKGFTLIELLAVIIILAIVAVIATPAVLDVIESARRSAFKANKLTSITIPSNVTSIANNAFAENSFADASSITIEGDATRFDSTWTSIGFPAK